LAWWKRKYIALGVGTYLLTNLEGKNIKYRRLDLRHLCLTKVTLRYRSRKQSINHTVPVQAPKRKVVGGKKVSGSSFSQSLGNVFLLRIRICRYVFPIRIWSYLHNQREIHAANPWRQLCSSRKCAKAFAGKIYRETSLSRSTLQEKSNTFFSQRPTPPTQWKRKYIALGVGTYLLTNLEGKNIKYRRLDLRHLCLTKVTLRYRSRNQSINHTVPVQAPKRKVVGGKKVSGSSFSQSLGNVFLLRIRICRYVFPV